MRTWWAKTALHVLMTVTGRTRKIAIRIKIEGRADRGSQQLRSRKKQNLYKRTARVQIITTQTHRAIRTGITVVTGQTGTKTVTIRIKAMIAPRRLLLTVLP